MTIQRRFEFLLDDQTDFILANLSMVTKLSKAELTRRSIYFLRILLDPNLKLSEIVKDQDWNKSLGEIMIPIPILAGKIGITNLKKSNEVKMN